MIKKVKHHLKKIHEKSKKNNLYYIFSGVLLFIVLIVYIIPIITKADDVEFAWVKQFGGASSDYGNVVKVDSSGVFSAGTFIGTANFNGVSLTATSGSDIYLVKSTTSGSTSWAIKLGGSGDESVSDIALDGDYIYVTGYYDGTMTIGTNILEPSGLSDIFIAKINKNTGSIIWGKKIGGAGDDLSNAITVYTDSNGTGVYTVGQFGAGIYGTCGNPTDFNPGSGVNELSCTPEATDIFISKLDGNGDYVWAKKIGADGTQVARDVAVDSTGVYFTGSFRGSNVDFNPGTGTNYLSSPDNDTPYLAKLNLDGSFGYATKYQATENSYAYGLALGASKIYLFGEFNDLINFGNNLTTNTGQTDLFFAKVNKSNGSTDFGHDIDATGSAYVHFRGASIEFVNGNEYIYYGGYFRYTINFAPTGQSYTMTSDTGTQGFYSKLDSNFNLLYAKQLHDEDTNTQSVVSGIYPLGGSVYVIGDFSLQSSPDFDPGPGEVSLSSFGGHDAFLLKLNNVIPAPALDLVGNNDPDDQVNINAGGSVNLTWSSTNVTSCSASAIPPNSIWNGNKDPNNPTGVLVTNITQNTEFKLTCIGTNGSSIEDVVNVTVSTLPTLTITANPATVDETQTTVPLTFTLTLSSSLSQGLTVTLSYDGSTATSPPSVNKDYTPALPTSVTVPAGSTSVSIPVFHVVDDDVYEGPTPETIKATITGTNQNQNITIGPPAVMNITSNEPIPVINIVPHPLPQGVEEPTPFTHFQLVPTVRSQENITVSFDLGGTATRNGDYTGINGSLPLTLTGTIEAFNNTGSTPEFKLIDDNIVETNETITTNNISILGNATVGSPGIFTIYDDDIPPPSVSLSFYPTSSDNSYQMSWEIGGVANSCTASSNPSNSDWSGPVTGGTKIVNNVTLNTTFSIICSNGGGTSSPDSVSIIVDKIPVNLSSNPQWKRGPLTVGGLEVGVSSIFEKNIRIDTTNKVFDKVLSSVGTPAQPKADWVYLNNNGGNLDPWVRDSSSSLVRLHTDSANDNIILQNGTIVYKTNETITEANKEQYKFIHETGTGNLFFGLGSGRLAPTVPSYTTGVGFNSFSSLINGESNTAIGANSGKSITGSVQNTLLGYNTNKNHINGQLNVSIGNEAGNCTSCDSNQNISIGALSGPANSGILSSVSIGYDAHANISNSMMFGNFSVLGWGFGTNPGGDAIKVGTNINNGNGATLTKTGGWTQGSDRNKKHDVVDLSYGLDEIVKLRPVDFKWNGTNAKDFGFIAQEVKEILPEIVSGKDGDMGISYGKFSPVLVEALQEQQKIIESYKEKIQLFKNRIEILENKKNEK